MSGRKASRTYTVLRHINEGNYVDSSLSMWQEHFKNIYGKKNQNLKPEELWFRVFENASRVAEDLRRYKYAAAFQSLAHVSCWFLGFANRIGKNMEDVVWSKYPYICPYCRKEKEDVIRSCSCGTRRTQLEEAETHVKETIIREDMIRYYGEAFRDKKPTKLDDWVTMYAHLYGNLTYSIPVEHIGFHLMEEIGEVSRVLRRRKEFESRVKRSLETGTDIQMARLQYEKDLDSELADVFSWTCTLVCKIQSLAKALQDFQDHMENMRGSSGRIRIQIPYAKPTDVSFEVPEVTFSSVLYWEYGKGCPSCGRNPCDENCFLCECKFMIKNGECGFDWSSKDKCNYGKSKSQSNKCGATSQDARALQERQRGVKQYGER